MWFSCSLLIAQITFCLQVEVLYGTKQQCLSTIKNKFWTFTYSTAWNYWAYVNLFKQDNFLFDSETQKPFNILFRDEYKILLSSKILHRLTTSLSMSTFVTITSIDLIIILKTIDDSLEIINSWNNWYSGVQTRFSLMRVQGNISSYCITPRRRYI